MKTYDYLFIIHRQDHFVHHILIQDSPDLDAALAFLREKMATEIAFCLRLDIITVEERHSLATKE